jgi:hypothetical protein
MPIPVTCPTCGMNLRAPDSATGRQVRCPRCETAFAVPLPEASTEPDRGPVAPMDSAAARCGRSAGPVSYGEAGARSLALGIGAICVGVVGTTFTFIPGIGGYLGLSLAALGLVLGLIGLSISVRNRRVWLAFPAAGSAVSLVALLVCVGGWLWWGAAVYPGGNGAGQKTAPDPLAKAKSLSKVNLEDISAAMHAFHKTQGSFPYPAWGRRTGSGQLSWRVAILPFLHEGKLFGQFDQDEPWDSPRNRQLLKMMPHVYAPAHGNAPPGRTYYQILRGPETPFRLGRGTRLGDTFPDGTSKTFLVVEAGQSVPWTKPEDIQFDRKAPLPALGGMFDGDFHALLADGTVRYIRRQRYPDDLLRNLIDPADGNAINWPD